MPPSGIWCASARWMEPSSSGLPKPMTARRINRPCWPSGQRDRPGHTLRCVSRPVPVLFLSGFGTHRDIVPHCPGPVPVMVASAKPPKPGTPHTTFSSHISHRGGGRTTRQRRGGNGLFMILFPEPLPHTLRVYACKRPTFTVVSNRFLRRQFPSGDYLGIKGLKTRSQA